MTDDVAFYSAVQTLIERHLARGRTPDLQALADENWRRLAAAAELRERLVFRYTGPTLQEFVVGSASAPVPIRLRSDGAHAVAFALLNPGRRVSLGPGRSRRAWHVAICRAVEAISRVDTRVAARLAFAAEHDGPGIRLWEREGRVLIRWRPLPGQTPLGA